MKGGRKRHREKKMKVGVEGLDKDSKVNEGKEGRGKDGSGLQIKRVC